VNTRRNVTELWVLTQNKPGLFRDLSLAMTANGASIAGARLTTGDNGLVMNVFYLLGPDGEAFAAQSGELSACLTDAGLDILSAHIEGVGAMAVDTFYVRSEPLRDESQKKLRAQLLDILRGPETKSKAA